MTRRLVLASLLAAAALVAAPALGQGGGTTAQTPQVQVAAAPFEDPVEPFSEPANTTVTVEVPCGSGGGNGTRAVTVEVASKPGWVTATVDPATIHVDTTDCEGTNGTAQGRTSLEVQTTAEAPAFEPGNLTVRASSDGMEPGTADTAVEAPFVAVFDVQTPQPVVTANPGSKVTVEVKLTNHGNGPVNVTSEHVNRSEAGGLEASLPGNLTVGARQTGDDHRRNATFAIQTPGGTGFIQSVGTVVVRWDASYAPDPSAGGASTTTEVRVKTQGFHLPGPGPVGVLAAAGAALALATRRRGR